MQVDNDRLIESLKKGQPSKNKPKMPDLRLVDNRNVAPVSNNITGNCFAKRDITTDHKWRKDSVESKQTIEAIQRKADSIAPLYNKGPLQLPVDESPDEIAKGRRR